MSLIYKVSDRELVTLRNDVFKERGIPALARNGFLGSPFSTAWFGKDGRGSYAYEFCRIAKDSRLDTIVVYIVKGDRWVQLHLNIFRLHPKIDSIEQLKGVDGLGRTLENDLENIDSFVRRWLDRHQPLTTGWNGKPVSG